MKVDAMRGMDVWALKKSAVQFAQKAGEPRFGLAILDELLAAGEDRQYTFHREEYRATSVQYRKDAADGETRYRACRDKVLNMLNNAVFFRKKEVDKPAIISGWELVGEVLASNVKEDVFKTLRPNGRDKARSLIQTLCEYGVLTRTVEMEKEYWTRQRMIWPEPTRDSCRLGNLGGHRLHLVERTFE